MNGDEGARHDKRGEIVNNHMLTGLQWIAGRWHKSSWKSFEQNRKAELHAASPLPATAFVVINQTLRSSELFMNKYEAERALNVFAADRVFLPSRIFLLASNFVINSYKNVRFRDSTLPRSLTRPNNKIVRSE